VPEAVLRYLTAARLPLSIRHGTDAMIAALPWHKASSIQRRTGAATPDDQATLSRAVSGIAETGTLLLGSGADNPVTLAFLPELHMVVLDEADVVASMERAFDLVQHASKTSAGTAPLPRTVNLISGASRTGDIGGRLVMGAHGPRQLVVLLTGGANKNGTL
jgi:L-lactate dehydrogenase complex protein LldG